MKKICVLLAVAIMMVSAGCTKSESTTFYHIPVSVGSIITLPVYINGETYVGNKPIQTDGSKIFIPYSAIRGKLISEGVLGASSFLYDEIYDEYYVSVEKLEHLEKINVCHYVSGEEETLYIDCFGGQFDYSWTESGYVAHALGGIDGFATTNSLEAFNYNYEHGHRVFEVDFLVTADEEMVAGHEFGYVMYEEGCDGVNVTKDQYMKGLSRGGFTTLSLDDILLLMSTHDDIYVVLDVKHEFSDDLSWQFEKIVDTANELGIPGVLDRIIPQLYDDGMYGTIMEIYPWKSMIYTVYYLLDGVYNEDHVVDFCYKHGIKVITMFAARGHETLFQTMSKMGIMGYVHTYNTPEEVETFRKMGFYGVYTDFLLP